MNITDLIIKPSIVLPEVYANVLDRCGKPKELSLSFLPTLDNKIWGLRKKKLWIIGARPSQGKSTMALNMAYNFARQGKTVVFFTLEMTNQTCVERLLSMKCGIDNFLIRTGKLAEVHESYSGLVNQFQEELNDMKLIFVESIGKTFQEIFTLLENYTPDVVILDYVQMIKSGKKSKKEAIDEYIKQLREYAIKRNFCAIVCSQVNRATHEQHKLREPEMWELKSSGDLEEHADGVMMLHWKHYYTREEEDKDEYVIRIAKNRDGRTGRWECIFKPEYYQIKEKVL